MEKSNLEQFPYAALYRKAREKIIKEMLKEDRSLCFEIIKDELDADPWLFHRIARWIHLRSLLMKVRRFVEAFQKI